MLFVPPCRPFLTTQSGYACVVNWMNRTLSTPQGVLHSGRVVDRSQLPLKAWDRPPFDAGSCLVEATLPYHRAEAFTVRSWEVRSTAIRPNLGRYPCHHS